MARPEFDLAVIGGGAGGLVVAAGGASLGAKVVLIESHRLGGDCLWTGCVPSKALLKSARIAHEMRHAARWGLRDVEPQPELARVMEHVAGVIAGIAPHDSPERFRALGVDVRFGSGRFVSDDTFELDHHPITARAFVIATGSRPALPPIPGLAETPYLTNETIFDLREPVPSLVVIGAGPIGCELAQAFQRLGSAVTLVDSARQILPREDADLATEVQRALDREGVRVLLDTQVASVTGTRQSMSIAVRTHTGTESLAASHVLVAAGRRANIETLGLEHANVAIERGNMVVDHGLRTTNPRIYAIGDAAGGYQFTHLAEHHAGIVLRRALFHLHWAKPSTVVPWCTFTDPELARIGLSESEAREQRIDHRVYRFAIEENDRARAEAESEGFAKLITDPRGRILGAGIVGPHAGELIAEYALAMQHGLAANALSGTIHPYPTWAQTNRRVADQRLKASLTPGRKAWLKRLLSLRGT